MSVRGGRKKPGPRRRKVCACGAPRRPGGNACHGCHARHNRDYRARKQADLDAKLKRLAVLEMREQRRRSERGGIHA